MDVAGYGALVYTGEEGAGGSCIDTTGSGSHTGGLFAGGG